MLARTEPEEAARLAALGTGATSTERRHVYEQMAERRPHRTGRGRE